MRAGAGQLGATLGSSLGVVQRVAGLGEWAGSREAPREFPFCGSRQLAEAQAGVRALGWGAWARTHPGGHGPCQGGPFPGLPGNGAEMDEGRHTPLPEGQTATGGPPRHTDLTQTQRHTDTHTNTQTQIYLAMSPCTQRQAHTQVHPLGPTCRDLHSRLRTHTHMHMCTHGRTPSWAPWDAHSQQGPGKPVAR